MFNFTANYDVQKIRKEERMEGIKEGIKEIIKKMLWKGKSIEEVAELTEVPKQEIEKIAKELKYS